MVYSQNLLDKLGFDADEIVNMKMFQNKDKYSVDLLITIFLICHILLAA